ncbi:hypothetical protein NE237_001352 [Protea cynaroides]|uniref:Uncharacterized protein n=1 Tax=Protea cynaroides TaxID=273540 RepID=A0A9Q0KTT7_9MAGN|nr:hypothetical protein NE237_001352 [Protea cynaroides]
MKLNFHFPRLIPALLDIDYTLLRLFGNTVIHCSVCYETPKPQEILETREGEASKRFRACACTIINRFSPWKPQRSSRAEKRFGRHFPSENVQMKVESGTCNVCSAPCSSCMHFNRATSFMASKIEDEFSDGPCRGKAASRCSFNDAGMLPSFKSRTCIDQQPTASETSNLLSASSSHDSFSQNAESKMALRTSDASEDVEMQPKLSSGGMNGQDKYQEQKGFDCNGDNGSCVRGANFADVPNDNHNVDMDRKNVSCSSASVCSFHPGGVEKKVNIDTASGCLIDFPFEVEERRNNSRRSDAKDLEENSCSHLRGPSECSMEHVESSLDRVVVSDGVFGKKTTAFNSADISLKVENSIPSLVRNAASASMKVYPCLEAEGATDSEDPGTEAVKCAEQRRKVEKSRASPEVADTHDPPVQSQPINESDASDIVEDDGGGSKYQTTRGVEWNHHTQPMGHTGVGAIKGRGKMEQDGGDCVKEEKECERVLHTAACKDFPILFSVELQHCYGMSYRL